MATRALRDAYQAGLNDAATNLSVAVERHRVGLATIADVLQARTVLAGAQLSLQSADGDLQVTRGGLALSMGLPANTRCDAVVLPPDIPVQTVSGELEGLIERAVLRRPDLAAAKANVLAASARVRALRGQGRPSLRAAGALGSTYYEDESDHTENYGAGLTLNVPVFTGFAQTHEVEQARWRAQAEAERAQSLQQRAVFEVFKAYYDLQTSAQRVRTADEMLASARQGHDAALGRYQEGLGSFTDLLAAQSLLTDARAQGIESRWAWVTACVQLAHDVGIIGSDADPTRDLLKASAGDQR
jgi:outer membrane protein